MKKIGIIGGLGPESTLDYYKGIIDQFKKDYEKTGYPEICIESLNLKEFTEYADKGAWQTVAAIISEKCENLYRSGCEIGAIASNTPHKVFSDVQANTSLSLISIIDSTCEFAEKKGLKKLCLIGTRFTMSGNFYQQVFQSYGIEIIVPDISEQDYIQNKLFTEIEFGILKQDTKQRFLSICKRIQEDNTTEGLILGCTELPMIINPEDTTMEYLDTTKIHVSKIVEKIK